MDYAGRENKKIELQEAVIADGLAKTVFFRTDVKIAHRLSEWVIAVNPELLALTSVSALASIRKALGLDDDIDPESFPELPIAPPITSTTKIEMSTPDTGYRHVGNSQRKFDPTTDNPFPCQTCGNPKRYKTEPCSRCNPDGLRTRQAKVSKSLKGRNTQAEHKAKARNVAPAEAPPSGPSYNQFALIPLRGIRDGLTRKLDLINNAIAAFEEE